MWRQEPRAVAAQIRGFWVPQEFSGALVCAGCGGGAARQTPPPPQPDFALSFSRCAVNIMQGTTSAGIQVKVQQPSNGFTGAAQVALSGMPAGVTAHPG